MLPRCGRAAHICGANETVQESVSKLKESQLPLKSEGCNDGTRFQGQLRFPGKLGMCPSLAEPVPSGFSKSHVSHETIRNPLQLFPRNSCKITAYCFRETRRSCSPHLEKLSLFSPPPPCAKSMAQGFRCLRAAIRATRPEPRQHF